VPEGAWTPPAPYAEEIGAAPVLARLERVTAKSREP